jgi:hypothetical protein
MLTAGLAVVKGLDQWAVGYEFPVSRIRGQGTALLGQRPSTCRMI